MNKYKSLNNLLKEILFDKSTKMYLNIIIIKLHNIIQYISINKLS